jgi:hypothetical protein
MYMRGRTRQAWALEGSEGRHLGHDDAGWVGGIHRPSSRAAQQNAQSRSVTFAWAVAMAAPVVSWAKRRLTCDGFQSSELDKTRFRRLMAQQEAT